MRTKIFCDIADYKTIKIFNKKLIVNGFTTNPSLMRKAGAKNYKNYSLSLLKICIPILPVPPNKCICLFIDFNKLHHVHLTHIWYRPVIDHTYFPQASGSTPNSSFHCLYTGNKRFLPY